jgi:CsgH protein
MRRLLPPAWLAQALTFVITSLLLATINPAGEGAMAANATSVIGWIEVLPVPDQNDRVTIRGHVQALQAVEGTFGLSVKRASRGNKSDNKQSGQFSAKAGESRALSTTTINLQPNDRLEVVLTLSVDGADIFKASLRSP